MANGNQEQFMPSASAFKEFQERSVLDSGDIHRFQLLHLNTITPPADNRKHHYVQQCTAAGATTPTSASPSSVHYRPFFRCTSCGSVKKRSPSSSSSVQEPPAKRAALCHPAPTTNADVACCDERQEEPMSLISGKSSLDDGTDAAFSTPVKPSPPVTNQNALNRTLSDITGYMSTQEARGHVDVQALNSKLREDSKINSVSCSPSPAAGTLPPLPRSTSAPIPSEYLPVAGGAFVPSPGSDQDSSDSKRLRRIKEKMKQMNHWIQKVTDENDMDEDNIDINPKKMSQDFQETKPNQEAVFVEENGDNLILHFGCPCGGRHACSVGNWNLELRRFLENVFRRLDFSY